MIKYTYIVLSVLVLAFSLPATAQGKRQKKKAKRVMVESRIVDQEGRAIPNAVIRVGEGLAETFTDENGNFSLRTKADNKILIKARGYADRWIDLTQGLPESELVLQKELLFTSGESKIQLPLGIQTNRRSLNGAVSKVSGEALESYPDFTLSNALQGRLMGLVVRQSASGLGNNSPSMYIRGLDRGGADGIITVVDGVERSIDYLIAEEIESVEVLKGPTAKILYGPRAANGVLLVTTKRGQANTRVLETTVEYGASFSTRMPEFLDSYEYAKLYNEARQNDGLPPFYSQEDLEGYRNSAGPNDQRYPNVDFYEYFLNDSAPYRKAALEYSGGDQANQYALVLGYIGGNGLEKLGQQPTLNRFNLRGNLDVELSDMISAHIGASGIIETREWGAINHINAFRALSSHRPNEYPLTIDDPVLMPEEGDESAVPPLGGSFYHPDNLYGSFLYSGFTKFQTFYGETSVGLDFDLGSILEGLSAEAFYTIDNFQYFENGKNEVPVTYAQHWFETADGQDTVQYYPLRRRVIEDNQRRMNQNFFGNTGWRATLAYEDAFDDHEVSANLTHFYWNQNHEDWVQEREFTNSVLRMKHGFSNKIYTEVILALMGSNRMAPENRYQLFPAIGAAWVISEEQFMRDLRFLDFLKLKGSFGILGYDRETTWYLYENRWNTNGRVWFNEQNRTWTTQTNLERLGNPNLEWEKSREINVGLMGLALENRLLFEFNYFNNYRYDIIQSPSYLYTAAAGGLYPWVNQGENRNKGVEGKINWSDSNGDFKYSFGGNFVYSKNEVVQTNEIQYPEDLRYTRQTGKPSDVMFGYVAEGLFTSQSQLENHAFQTFGEYGLGDIAYKDLNGDDVIDALDRKVLGNSYPRVSLGLNLDLNYKRFGLFVLGTAELGVDHWLNNSYYWNFGERKYSVVARDRWHSTNNPDGTYPALTTTSGANNFRNSSFWIEDASFFRLKNVEFSYTLPNTSVANSYRFFVRGANLLVLSTNKALDPEVLDAGVTSYPVFRTITGGVSINF